MNFEFKTFLKSTPSWTTSTTSWPAWEASTALRCQPPKSLRRLFDDDLCEIILGLVGLFWQRLDDGGLDGGLTSGLIGRDFFEFCFQLRVRIKYKSNQIFIGSAGPATCWWTLIRRGSIKYLYMYIYETSSPSRRSCGLVYSVLLWPTTIYVKKLRFRFFLRYKHTE
jgi:hypothetical protein